MVAALESTGHRVTWTANEARARLASDEELRAFGPNPALAPLQSRVVIEIMHATYGADDEPLEVVVSVRPAEDNVIVFETYEGAESDDEDDELATEPGGESPRGGTSP
jgi:hypothetical protein